MNEEKFYPQKIGSFIINCLVQFCSLYLPEILTNLIKLFTDSYFLDTLFLVYVNRKDTV